MLQEEMAQVKEDARTQQEEDSRWAAVKKKEGVDAAEDRQAAIDETVEALFGVKRTGGVDAAEERQAAIDETAEALLEGFFGWALQEERQGRIDFHKKLKALEEKRQARDGAAPLKEGWQVKDFRLITPR